MVFFDLEIGEIVQSVTLARFEYGARSFINSVVEGVLDEF
jgi:hypothetical protein